MKTTVERPWQRQGQSGTLYEEAKRFLAGTSNFMGFGYSRIEQRHGGVGLGMKPCEREEEAMVQPNTRRRGRNRKPRWEPGYDEYGEYQDPRMYEKDEAQSQHPPYGEEIWTQYQGGGVCEEAQRGATARAEEQTMGIGYQWLETSPVVCIVWQTDTGQRIVRGEWPRRRLLSNQQIQHQGVRRLRQRRVVEKRTELRRAAQIVR